LDTATRKLLELRRDGLLAQNNVLRDKINTRSREVVTGPNFDPRGRSEDPQLTRLIKDQDLIIDQIQEIDEQLRG
jgi:hypothetical protein